MPASVPSTAWSDNPGARPPGPWSSAWWNTSPPRAVVPRGRTYDNLFVQSPRKRPHPVIPERLRTFGHGHPGHDDQLASSSVPPSRNMSGFRCMTRLPSAGTLVSGRPGDLVGLRVEHRVEYLGDLLRDEPVEPGLGRVPANPYGVLGHSSVSWFPIAVVRFGG